MYYIRINATDTNIN